MDDFEDFVDLGPERYTPIEYNSLGMFINSYDKVT